MSEEDEVYETIREALACVIGQRIVDITQHSREEWNSGSEAYVMLMLENGVTVKFWITDPGFVVDEPE